MRQIFSEVDAQLQVQERWFQGEQELQVPEPIFLAQVQEPIFLCPITRTTRTAEFSTTITSYRATSRKTRRKNEFRSILIMLLIFPFTFRSFF
jgi:hypothetical protein